MKEKIITWLYRLAGFIIGLMTGYLISPLIDL